MKYLPILLLLLAACKQDYPGQEVPPIDPAAPVPVRVIVPRLISEPIPIEAGGTVAAKDELRLSFKVGGIVERTYAEEGRQVRKGQLLATLRTTEIDAQVRKATRARDKADRDLKRIEALYADSATTLENVQNLRTAREIAEADVEIAEFNRRYAKIYAPATGRIVRRLAEAGELVGPGAPVYRLAGEGRQAFVLRVGVADRDVLELSLGDSAHVRLDAYPDQPPVPATVTEIAAAADPRTGAFAVELTLLPRPEQALRIGFVGRASIYPAAQPAHYRLPLETLVEGEGRDIKIFTLDGQDRARARRVRMLRLFDSTFVVAARELPAGERLITSGAAYLTEGRPVTY